MGESSPHDPPGLAEPLQLLGEGDPPPVLVDRSVRLAANGIELVPMEEEHAVALDRWVERDAASFSLMRGSPIVAGDSLAFIRSLDTLRERGDDVPFVVLGAARSNAAGELLGYTRYLHVNRMHRTVEVGGTWYSAEARGTIVNPTCKRLLLGHAFAAGFNRVAIQTDERNTRSRRAIERVGATYEGALRAHLLAPDGRPRTTVVYSVVRSEWHRVEANLRLLEAAAPPVASTTSVRTSAQRSRPSGA